MVALWKPDENGKYSGKFKSEPIIWYTEHWLNNARISTSSPFYIVAPETSGVCSGMLQRVRARSSTSRRAFNVRLHSIVYIESPNIGQSSRLNKPILGPSRDDRQICSMTWGHGRRDKSLFFSVEAPSPDDDRGEIYAYDWQNQARDPQRVFDAVHGAGALIALDSTGQHVAIAANTPDSAAPHSLYLYGSRISRPLIAEVELPERPLMSALHIMDVQWWYVLRFSSSPEY